VTINRNRARTLSILSVILFSTGDADDESTIERERERRRKRERESIRRRQTWGTIRKRRFYHPKRINIGVTRKRVTATILHLVDMVAYSRRVSTLDRARYNSILFLLTMSSARDTADGATLHRYAATIHGELLSHDARTVPFTVSSPSFPFLSSPRSCNPLKSSSRSLARWSQARMYAAAVISSRQMPVERPFFDFAPHGNHSARNHR